MHFRFFLLTLFIVGSTTLFAQEMGFTDGYIITNKKDTLHGLVKHIQTVPYHVMEDVLFKDNENAEKKRYSPDEVIEFMTGETVYHSVSYEESSYVHKKAFMELIIEGEVNLYHWSNTVAQSSSPRMSSAPTGVGMPSMSGGSGMTIIKDLSTPYLLRKKDKDATPVGSLGFKKMASNYFADNTELAAKIKEKVYKKDDLEEIVTVYNKWARNPLR